MHAIDIDRAVEMIDFVLENARVPARSVDGAGLRVFVEAFHTNAAKTGDQGGVSVDAEAAFEELDLLVAHRRELRVDDYVEGKWLALALGDLLGCHGLRVLRKVFDDGELEVESDLGRGESDAGSVAQSFMHEVDELLNFGRADFIGAEFASALAQDFFADLDEFEAHGFQYPVACIQ